MNGIALHKGSNIELIAATPNRKTQMNRTFKLCGHWNRIAAESIE